MSSTTYIDEVLDQCVDVINIGTQEWIQRYVGICQMISTKTYKRRWMLFRVIAALKQNLTTVAITNNFTQEQVDEIKAILNFPLRLTPPEEYNSNPFPIKPILISMAVSVFLSALTFLFTQ